MHLRVTRLAILVGFIASSCLLGADAPDRPKLVVQSGHSAQLVVVAFSADAKRAVTGSVDGTARVWDTETGKELHTLKGHAGDVSTAEFSPDGKRILTGSSDATARVWNSETGQELHSFTAHTGSITAARFDSDGKRIITAGLDNTPRVWDAETGKGLLVLKGHNAVVVSVGFSKDAKRMVTASADATARVWDADAKELKTLRGHAGWARVATFNSDGKRVLTGGDDGTGRVWDSETGKELHSLKGHSAAVYGVAFNSDGKRALTWSADKTVRVWDPETGKELHNLKGPAAGVRVAAFSPDGKRILIAGLDNTPRMWDTETGKEVASFKGHTTWVHAATFSSDGKQLLTGGSEGTARVWNATTGAEVQVLKGYASAVYTAVFSADGRRVAVGGTGAIARVWDAETGKELLLKGHISAVYAIAFSSNGKLILTRGGDNTVKLWDAETGKALRSLNGHAGGTLTAAFSADGKRVVTGGLLDNTVRIWDVESGNQLHALPGHKGAIKATSFSPDGKRALSGSSDNTAKLWDAETGKELHTLKGHTARLEVAAFSADGKQVLTGSVDNSAKLWDAETGKERHTLGGFTGGVYTAAFSPDGKRAVTGGYDKTPRVWDTENGKALHTLEGHSGAIESVVISPNGKQVLTASSDGTAKLWDIETGKERQTLKGHASSVHTAAFNSDGTQVLTRAGDSTARLWDPVSGKELCQLVSFTDGGWAVVDPTGRYDASNGGDVEGLHWVVGNEAIGLKQLKNRYYEPGLLVKSLGFNNQAARPVDAFQAAKLHPEVAVNLPAGMGTQAEIKLTNRGGGIGKVRVLVNGQELLADARGAKPDTNAKETTVTVNLATAVNLMAGKPNEIEVIAYNAEGYLASRGIRKVFTPEGKNEERPPELFAIVCGVSHYADPKLNLRFAAKDAEDFAAALELAGNRLFGAEKVHLTLLTTSDLPKATSPTKANIQKAFEAARAAKPGDVLVVYLAGHGTTLGRGTDMYVYPTRDARTLDGATLADPAVLSATAITSSELTDWLLKIGANKKVMVLDTCAAGAAAAQLTGKRDVDGDQVRALDQLKDRTGFHVLMGCAADTVSYEATQFAQGLLTYSLLEGMKGAALQDGGVVDVGKLFGYATMRVPGLAVNVGGVQRPEVIAPKAGQPFAIGRLTEADRPKVRLALARPLILRSNFQDADELLDVLDLGKKVDSQLRGAAARGRDASLVFVDAAEFPDAHRVAGRYQTEGDTVTVAVSLFKGKERVGQVKVTGLKSKPDDLARKVGTEVERLLAGSK